MADFSKFFRVMQGHEGGFADNPSDKGGMTFRGIAYNFHPEWAGWPTVLAAMKALGISRPVAYASWAMIDRHVAGNAALSKMVEQFYKAKYWNPLRLDEVESQSIATQLADFGVNAGTSRPAKLVQYVLAKELEIEGIAVDGIIGRKTINALNAAPAAVVYDHLIQMRRAFHTYRANAWKAEDNRSLAAWHTFFHTELKLRPDASQRKFLNAWLSRTTAPFVA
ncbi:hypothetical protein MUN82_03850 [Hymenobacter aerilatus]|uniref:TtsA-like Glycoside hydrolase family 108 domain-containing protein n=1 Tax=Hymenobacter aerilatus TaxID=2932251 RepID=A0A8T9SVN0_9BACT|nr:glycosyl hydrolase 108 family protein [Hymenobacter aerilatus]UOR06232.1 hypothetical protein MUN82_03850 [Hymenobacter aerilatus]